MQNLLVIETSPRKDSISSTLCHELVARLKTLHPNLNVKTRSIATSMEFVSEEMIGAFYTPVDARTDEQKKLISLSDALVDELEWANGLIIAVPMWNFTMPAALKAWFDLTIRVGRTFKYKPDGGLDTLLKDRKTYLMVATGGVPVGSPYDFLTPSLKNMLGFMGIKDVEIIAAEGTNKPNAADVIQKTRDTIQNIAA